MEREFKVVDGYNGELTMEILHDDLGNTATIKEVMILPYKGATKKQKGYVLTLTADYDNDFIYHVSVHESRNDVMKKLDGISCNTWK